MFAIIHRHSTWMLNTHIPTFGGARLAALPQTIAAAPNHNPSSPGASIRLVMRSLCAEFFQFNNRGNSVAGRRPVASVIMCIFAFVGVTSMRVMRVNHASTDGAGRWVFVTRSLFACENIDEEGEKSKIVCLNDVHRQSDKSNLLVSRSAMLYGLCKQTAGKDFVGICVGSISAHISDILSENKIKYPVQTGNRASELPILIT